MTEQIKLAPEQIDEIVARVRGGMGGTAAEGLGRAAGTMGIHPGAGLGCGGYEGPLSDIYAMLALGSPRLALARALGYRMIPFYINIRATFSNVDTTDVPDVGSDVKIDQDTLVDQMTFLITNKSETANDNTQATLRDFFFNFQSGIEATLDIKGTPRPTLAPKFTPLKNLADVVNCTGWPRGFVLTYQQQLQAAFRASVTLPSAPMEVTLTFRAFQPDTEAFVGMTNKEAIEGLSQKCGVSCNWPYR
jgi:hypothetical protein